MWVLVVVVGGSSQVFVGSFYDCVFACLWVVILLRFTSWAFFGWFWRWGGERCRLCVFLCKGYIVLYCKGLKSVAGVYRLSGRFVFGFSMFVGCVGGMCMLTFACVCVVRRDGGVVVCMGGVAGV